MYPLPAYHPSTPPPAALDPPVSSRVHAHLPSTLTAKPRPDWNWRKDGNSPVVSHGCACMVFIAQLALLYSTPILDGGGLLFFLMPIGLMVRPRHSSYTHSSMLVCMNGKYCSSTLQGGGEAGMVVSAVRKYPKQIQQ